MPKMTWSDLSSSQQRLIYVGGVAETVVTVAALRDLVTRPGAQIRGPKAAWLLAFVVQPFGPLAYFAVGRR
jgi:hypothetical protein